MTTYMDKQDAAATKSITLNADYNLRQTSHRAHGHMPDITKTFWKNRIMILLNTPPMTCFQRPSNLSHHNLCEGQPPPPGIEALLGLNAKFCIEHHRPRQPISTSLNRLRRSVRLHCHHSDNTEEPDTEGTQPHATQEDRGSETTCIPSMCIPSKWDPPEANNKFETCHRRVRTTHLTEGTATANNTPLQPHSSTMQFTQSAAREIGHCDWQH